MSGGSSSRRAMLFPTVEDKDIILAWLKYSPSAQMDSDATGYVEAGPVRLHGASVAWFDTAGAVYATLEQGYGAWYAAKVINYICEIVGVPDRVEQEQDRTITTDVIRTKWFFGGQEISTSAPFVIVGALSVRAWREGVKTNV